MNKITELAALEAEIGADASLPLRESNLVFGEGDPACVVLFIGEAPGLNEDQQKRPFVGRAGQLLRQMIRELDWKESNVYITNIVKRRPPENRDPLPSEIEAYAPYLSRQIGIIDPKIIVPLGRFAMNYFLPEAKISRDQGKVFKAGGRFVVPMFHPAAALRSPAVAQAFRESFKKLPGILAKVTSGEPALMELPAAKEQKKKLQQGLF